jgi:pimeloyl-ACP methyl ester carboxylesterase
MNGLPRESPKYAGMLRRALFVAAAVLCLGTLTGAPILETGEINGAKFTLARPEKWQGGVLLLAHGLRAPDRPLVADLFPEQLAYKTLVEQGMIVAKTSYRRNGLIIADAIDDLDALRAHIVSRFGVPDRVLLQGESMGGLIVTLMAEREPEHPLLYHGAVAIGAALDLREPGATRGISLQPRIPLLFLANQSELAGPRNYVTADLPRIVGLAPALFRVSRDGHVNVNQRERLVALRALNHWIERGRSSLPHPPPSAASPFYDATVAPEPVPSQVLPHPDGRGFDARVLEVSAVYGNVFVNAQPADFEAAGIARMTWCQLTVGEMKFRVLHGRDFNSVRRGEWVTFANADGFHWLARNFADAAATAKLQVGDVVRFRRFAPATP